MQIEGQIEVDVTIGGVQVPLGPTTLQSLATIQSTQQTVPTMEMQFIDHDRLFSNGVLAESAPISVKMDPQLGRSCEPMSFRLFNILSLRPTPLGQQIHLSGIADQPRLFREVVSEVIDGPASKVISQLGSKLGLKLDVDATFDKMKWLPNNMTIGQFMRQAMDHAFAGGGAAMQLAMTFGLDGKLELRFKDVLKQMAAASGVKLRSESLSNNVSDMLIEDFSYRSHGGTLNTHTGYSSEIVQPALEGIMDIFKDVTFGKLVTNMNMSSDMQSMFKAAFTRREFFPPEMGNTHEKYAEAKNSNQRTKATLSRHVHVMTRQVIPVKLLDPIEIEIASGYENEIDTELSGKYVVLGRTQYVRGQNYRERIHMSNQGSN